MTKANHWEENMQTTYVRELVSRIYKEILQLNKKTTQ